jgi:putative nucleotidyltransferase with HDIG domain
MSRSFKFYVAFTFALAAVLVASANWSIPQNVPAYWNALGAFVVLGLLSEASYFKLRVGRAETQSSVAFIPFFASFMLFETGWVAAIAAISILFSEAIVKRKHFIRVLFNVSQVAVSICLASLVYKALGGPVTLDGFVFHPWAIAAGVAVYFAINSAAVSAAVAFDRGEVIWKAWLRIGGVSIIYDLVSSLLAPLLAYLYVNWQIIGLLGLILPLYLVRHLYQITLQLEQVNKDLLELMVKAIEARDPYTSGHSQRVSEIAGAMARQLGLGTRQVEQVTTAGLLHDVGKIHEEYAPLLRKEGKLDATETALMQTHSIRSAELVGTISAFRGVITEAVRHHHENFDGTGYPNGLAREAIPIGARIIMIADTVDAMTTNRSYRLALSYERVVLELRKYAGTQFDPHLVEVFLESASIRSILQKRVPQTTTAQPVTKQQWKKAADRALSL